jgi:hypothetical protein
MAGIASGSCIMAGFGINGVESSVSSTTFLFMVLISKHYFH